MKKLLLKSFLLSVFLLTISESFAQQWRANLPAKSSGDYTFFELQKAFYDYWDPYNVQDGYFVNELGERVKARGYKHFKRWEWYWEPRVDRKTGKFPEKSAWDVWQEYKVANNVKSVGGNWQSIGDHILDPIDGGSIQESGTGRLNCAAFDPIYR